MRKKIYHATIYYRWRTIRYVKGVEKRSKTWKQANLRTCVREIEPEKLEQVEYFTKKLRLKHKSTSDIEIKIDKIEDVDYLCMSHDVY